MGGSPGKCFLLGGTQASWEFQAICHELRQWRRNVHSQADKILASTKVTVHQSSIQDNTLANPLTSLSTSTSTFRRKPQQQKKSTKRRQCVTTGVQRYVQTQIVRASDFCDTSICVRVCMCGACMFCWSFLMWQS